MSEVIASGTDRTRPEDVGGHLVVWSATAYVFTFSAYEIVGVVCDEPNDILLPLAGALSHEDTTDPAKARVALEGFIKWDGCSEFTFEADHHWCEAWDYAAFIILLAWLHNKAKDVIPSWYGDEIKLDVSVVRGKP